MDPPEPTPTIHPGLSAFVCYRYGGFPSGAIEARVLLAITLDDSWAATWDCGLVPTS